MIVTARTPGTTPEGNADVYVMRADGTGIRPVTRTTRWESGADWGPRRSAEAGTRSAFACLPHRRTGVSRTS
jgi:hypothetical protein